MTQTLTQENCAMVLFLGKNLQRGRAKNVVSAGLNQLYRAYHQNNANRKEGRTKENPTVGYKENTLSNSHRLHFYAFRFY